MGENIEGCVNKNPEVIRPIDNPYSQTGGLAVLKGNLAPDGSVVKRSAVCDEMLVHEDLQESLRVMKKPQRRSRPEGSIREMSS